MEAINLAPEILLSIFVIYLSRWTKLIPYWRDLARLRDVSITFYLTQFFFPETLEQHRILNFFFFAKKIVSQPLRAG